MPEPAPLALNRAAPTLDIASVAFDNAGQPLALNERQQELAEFGRRNRTAEFGQALAEIW